MYRTKHTLIILAYAFLIVLFFCGGYIIGIIGDNINLNTVIKTPDTVPVSAIENAEDSAKKYELILEDYELYLYKLVGERRELLYSHPINEEIFPKSDMEQLRNGVYFDNLSDAQSLLENFVS